MKRHLFLVLNHGPWNNRLENVDVDIDGYKSFFQSPEGGFWTDDEISVYKDNFYFNVFKEDIQYQRNIQDPYELIVFVFCGHGCTDENGEQWFEIRPDSTVGSDMSLTQFRQACAGTRTLLISDACSSLYTGPLFEQRTLNFSVRGVDEDLSYAMSCRTLYNSIVRMTPAGTFVFGFAASRGESARENENGGYYSQSLLKEAKSVINALKNDSRYRVYDNAPFLYIHGLAREDVIKMSNNEQHPTIDMPRDKQQLPFIVVPKNI